MKKESPDCVLSFTRRDTDLAIDIAYGNSNKEKTFFPHIE